MIGQLGSHPYGDLIDFGAIAAPAVRNGLREGDSSHLSQWPRKDLLLAHFFRLNECSARITSSTMQCNIKETFTLCDYSPLGAEGA